MLAFPKPVKRVKKGRDLSSVRKSGLQPVKAGSTPAHATTRQDVAVAQLVERETVVLDVVDSSSTGHPIITVTPTGGRPVATLGDTAGEPSGVTGGRDRHRLEKPSRQTDPAYLDFVRQQPCAVHGPSCPQQPLRDPHHLVTVGARGSDRYAIPLCRDAHRELHQIGASAHALRYGLDLFREALRLNLLYDGRL